MTTNFERYARQERERASEAERRDMDLARARFTIGTKVLQQRLAVGLTQQQLAAASGIAQADISRIEHGRANPTTDTLEALGRPLGVTLDLVSLDQVKQAAEA